MHCRDTQYLSRFHVYGTKRVSWTYQAILYNKLETLFLLRRSEPPFSVKGQSNLLMEEVFADFRQYTTAKWIQYKDEHLYIYEWPLMHSIFKINKFWNLTHEMIDRLREDAH